MTSATIINGDKMKMDIVDNWLNTVAFSHSGSPQTRAMYSMNLRKFLSYTGKTAEQIQTDYETSEDRQFKRGYAQLLMGFIGELQKAKYSASSVSVAVNTVKSFFKYSDFPLGFIPTGKSLVEFHNRDISKEEIIEVLKLANVRDRAFFVMLSQSGLRPATLANLKLGDVEGILSENTPIPCKIQVEQENTKGKFQGYFSFVGKESVDNLKDYLKTRPKTVTAEDYVFAMFGNEAPVSPGVLTHIFRRIVEKLRAKGVFDYKTKIKKLKVEDSAHKVLRTTISRGELRLYNLRKFFRKYAGQAGADYVNFWMGHTSALGVDLHYFSRDVELHRKVYAEKAMPFLRLETRTPSETEKQIEELRRENAELKTKVDRIEASKSGVEALLKRVIDLEKKLGRGDEKA